MGRGSKRSRGASAPGRECLKARGRGPRGTGRRHLLRAAPGSI